MKFVNIEKLEKFLQDNLKSEVYDLEAFKLDVCNEYCAGNHAIELSRFETKSGETKTLDFVVKFEESLDLDSDTDELTFEF